MEMVTEKMLSALNAALAETFEGLAFAEAEPCQRVDILPKPVQDYRVAVIELQQPFSAKLSLFFEKEQAEELFETTVGLTAEDPRIVDDMLGEFANTIFGCFVRNLLNNGESFNLGYPKSGSQAQRIAMEEVSKSMLLSCDVDMEPIYLSFSHNAPQNDSETAG